MKLAFVHDHLYLKYSSKIDCYYYL